MIQEKNGVQGDWAIKCANAKPIAIEIKTACLALFKQGYGYRRSSRELGLNPYTVREWKRRFKLGDELWANRDGSKFCSCNKSQNMVKCQHEKIKTSMSSGGTDVASDRSVFDSEQSDLGKEDQVFGRAERSAEIPLYCAHELCERIIARGMRKKKEMSAVQELVDNGHSVKDACRLTGTSRCDYYRAKKPSKKSESDAALVDLMCEIENNHHISSTYGVERLTAEVNKRLLTIDSEIAKKILGKSKKVNHKRIQRLMRENNIHSHIRRKKHPDNYYKEVKAKLTKNFVPNILQRIFTAEKPMHKLTTDVTYIPCSDHKFMYLSVLFDLFNNEVVSWTMSTVNSEEFVKRMLTRLERSSLNGALIHSDQGSVYWSNGWVKVCKELNITRSMSRRGNCWDNSLSENFFSSMKCDLGLTKGEYKTLKSSEMILNEINAYIQWYNTGRIQKKLNYLSPAQFKEAFFHKDQIVVDTIQSRMNLTRDGLLGGEIPLRLGLSPDPFGGGVGEVSHPLLSCLTFGV